MIYTRSFWYLVIPILKLYSVPWPDNPPIVTPTPDVPATPEEGIGEIGAGLSGILDWLAGIFAQPTATIDFGPLVGISVKDKFPFSLPFDLAAIFTSLQASPEAPEWVLKWGTANTTSVQIPIQLEQFEPWAKIVRFGVVILFLIGLVVVTRNVIGG